MRRAACATALVLAVASLVGCTGNDPYDIEFSGEKIDVDTPELREAKKEAGIEPCEPGQGANDLPEVTLPCFGGGPDVDLSTLEGPLIVNVWAGWCVPCRQEMPTLEAFHQQYGDQVGVVGVNVRDPQTGAAMDLVNETGVTYPLLSDPTDDLAGQSPFTAAMRIPMLVFVRADGSVSPVVVILESLDELVELANEHLGVQL